MNGNIFMAYGNVVTTTGVLYDDDIASEMYYKMLEDDIDREDEEDIDNYGDVILAREIETFNNSCSEVLYFSDPIDFPDEPSFLSRAFLNISNKQRVLSMKLGVQEGVMEKLGNQVANRNFRKNVQKTRRRSAEILDFSNSVGL